jgi:hypothetical protein
LSALALVAASALPAYADDNEAAIKNALSGGAGGGQGRSVVIVDAKGNMTTVKRDQRIYVHTRRSDQPTNDPMCVDGTPCCG